MKGIVDKKYDKVIFKLLDGLDQSIKNGLSKREVARRMEMNVSTISRWLSGERTAISLRDSMLIQHFLNGLNSFACFSFDPSDILFVDTIVQQQKEDTLIDKVHPFPTAFARPWLLERVQSNLFSVQIRTDSEDMAPTICAGDKVLIDKKQTDIKQGKIYCFKSNGKMRLARLFKKKNGIEAVYDSTSISRELHSRSLVIIGRAVWIGRDLDSTEKQYL